MIEIVADRLSPSERDRWRAILDQSALAARFSRADPAVRMVGAVLCGAAFLASLDGAGHGSLVTVVRMLALGAITFSTASTIESLRAGRGPWPNGRYVLPWGYVEVENGALRAYPRSELTHEIRGRRFGLGRVRLGLRAARWSTSMTIDPSEAERIATTWAEPAELPPQPATGYREPPPPSEIVNGRAPRWRPPRSLGRVVLTIGIAPIALWFSMPMEAPLVGVPADSTSAPIAEPTTFDAYTSHFADALRAEPDASEVSAHLERCSLDEMTAGTIASYLTLGLERRRLGPADLGAIPRFALEPDAPVRIWARCRWAVDPETGMFARVEARWGLARSGAPRIERRATIGVADVTGALATCLVGLPLSPRTVAHASLRLASLVVRHDVYRAGPRDGATRTEQCMMDRADSIPVRSAPSSS